MGESRLRILKLAKVSSEFHRKISLRIAELQLLTTARFILEQHHAETTRGMCFHAKFDVIRVHPIEEIKRRGSFLPTK